MSCHQSCYICVHNSALVSAATFIWSGLVQGDFFYVSQLVACIHVAFCIAMYNYWAWICSQISSSQRPVFVVQDTGVHLLTAFSPAVSLTAHLWSWLLLYVNHQKTDFGIGGCRNQPAKVVLPCNYKLDIGFSLSYWDNWLITSYHFKRSS